MAAPDAGIAYGAVDVGTDQQHWDRIYSSKDGDDSLSWYQACPGRSLALIESTGVEPPASIIDVGGGLSALAAMLLDRGDYDIWLLDISTVALVTARKRLCDRADRVRFIHADIARAALPKAHFDVWHDRAVFHFLTDTLDRQRYVEAALSAVKPGGHLLIATFAIDGPASCSGLPVMRYDANTLASCFAGGATLCRTEIEEHRTPAGAMQRFVYCLMQRGDRRNPG